MARYPKGSTAATRARTPDAAVAAVDAAMQAAMLVNQTDSSTNGDYTFRNTRPDDPGPSFAIEQPEDPAPMIIKFETVTLHYEIPRPRVVQGLATQGTSFFDVKQPALKGYYIELDTSVQLLRIGIDNVSVRLPVAAVKYFGLTLEESAALADAKRAAAEKARLANEAAAAETERLAAQPAV